MEIGIEERGARGALMEKTESQFANRHHDSGFLARARDPLFCILERDSGWVH